MFSDSFQFDGTISVTINHNHMPVPNEEVGVFIDNDHMPADEIAVTIDHNHLPADDFLF